MDHSSMAVDQVFEFPKRWRPVFPIAKRLLALDSCQKIYASFPAELRGAEFISRVVSTLGLKADCSSEGLSRIPTQGGLLVVANHPFGAAEGLVLAHQLLQVRADVRILANHLLNRIPQMQDLVIPVDPFGGPNAAAGNRSPMRRALRWLKSGGVLVVFPAGEVSHLQISKKGVVDPPWTEDLASLVRLSGAAVLPVWFGGNNGAAFQIAGLIHRRLRTALLPRQLLNKRRHALPMRIGKVLPAERLTSFTSDAELVAYLRLRTYLLGKGGTQTQGQREASTSGQKPVAAPQPIEHLAFEVASLPEQQRLTSNGEFDVYLAEPRQIPCLLLEIGRLRELTFRAVGEGTGQEFDIDVFDSHYSHLFIWQRSKSEVVGAYRIGRVDAAAGSLPQQFYTHTLFHYGEEFLERLGPALELGRSFVRPEYQRQFAPLLLLWKGIGAFVARHPQYRTLFGPVSISRDYSQLSKDLLTGALKETCFLPELANLVQPRTPIRLHSPKIPGCDRLLLETLRNNLDEVSELIAELDPDHGGIPVLLRHYLGLGGRVLAFNLDREFSDVVDALVIVDLAHTDRKSLGRYLGRSGASEFLTFHRQTDPALAECA